jgi:nitroimidazol reductase NimA-like FMN-containing flavoprotein (pyridoxamine 5'-phosphate oxidase superfamily)
MIGELTTMTRSDCCAHLQAGRLGRVAFARDRQPLLLPVNYAFQYPFIVLRTDLSSVWNDLELTVVAFEVDGFDPSGAWGWSVVVEGPCIDFTDGRDEESAAMRRVPVSPWSPRPHDRWFRIVASRMTGRRFGLVPQA